MKKKLSAFIGVLIISLLTLSFLCSCGSTLPSMPQFSEFKVNGDAVASEICAVKDDYKSIVTIISDDGYYESGVIFNDLAKELDLNVTVAGAVNIIAPKEKKWKEIESEGHVDLVSHSYTHVKVTTEANLTNEQVRHEYADAKEYYKQNFKTPSFTIVAPENTTTPYGFTVWQEIGLLAARLGTRGENPLHKKISYGTAQGEWLNLRMRGLYDAKDTAGRNAWIDSAIKNETWLIEMWHDISPNGNVHFQPISTEKAKEHMSYISERQKEKKIWAASFTQAVSYLYQRDNGETEAYEMDGAIAVKYNRIRDDLPWDEFNVPVTVKIALPQNVQIESVHDDKSFIDFEEKDDYVLVNVPTDGTTVYLHEKTTV